MRENMIWIIISVIVVIVDQLTKYIVVKNIGPSEMIPVIDNFFYLTFHKNQGGAWGILQNSRPLFLILIPIVSAFIIYYMIKNKNGFLRFTLALILGGAIGNYIDRVVEGRVTDFLLFYIGSYPFPVFNAADMAITCGTILLAVYVLFIYKDPAKLKQDGKNEK
jgi:signal peptidase II